MSTTTVVNSDEVCISPQAGILLALTNQNIKLEIAIAEWIDNALQAGATRIEIVFGPAPGKKGSRHSFIAIRDNGHGAVDVLAMFALGKHVELQSGIGRYGVGGKFSALRLCGPDSSYMVSTVYKGRRTTLNQNWSKLANASWKLPRPRDTAAGSADRGTTIRCTPGNKRMTDGDFARVCDELGYMYSPALTRGVSISLQMLPGNPIPLRPWLMPELQPGTIHTRISVDGKTAEVSCGVVAEGMPNPKRGFTYMFGDRVILPASGKGCGSYNPTRIVGVVKLDSSWELATHKDDIIDSDELFLAVERACLPVLKAGEQSSMQLRSTALASRVAEMLSLVGSEAKERRTKGVEHGIHEPVGTGRRRKRATKTQPGTGVGAVKPPNGGGVRIDFDEIEDGTVGEYKEPNTVILNKLNAGVKAAIEKDNDPAVLVMVAAVLSAHYAVGANVPVLVNGLSATEPLDRNLKMLGNILSQLSEIDGKNTSHP